MYHEMLKKVIPNMYQGSVGATLIVAALGMLVDDEGLSPHEAFDLIEQIKRDTFHALAEMSAENKGGKVQ